MTSSTAESAKTLKLLVGLVHKHLGEMGHEMPLGHVYEALAKANGHKSWNVAKADPNNIQPIINQVKRATNTDVGSDGSTRYEIRVVAAVSDGVGNEIEIKKYYTITAKDEQEARDIIGDYLSCRVNENDKCKINQTKQLLDAETNGGFWGNGWEVIWNSSVPRIGDVYPKPKPIDSKTMKAKSMAIKLMEDVEKYVNEGLHPVYKEDFKRFMHDYWPDLPWDDNGLEIAVKSMLEDQKSLEIAAKVKEKFGYDLVSDWNECLRRINE